MNAVCCKPADKRKYYALDRCRAGWLWCRNKQNSSKKRTLPSWKPNLAAGKERPRPQHTFHGSQAAIEQGLEDVLIGFGHLEHYLFVSNAKTSVMIKVSSKRLFSFELFFATGRDPGSCISPCIISVMRDCVFSFSAFNYIFMRCFYHSILLQLLFCNKMNNFINRVDLPDDRL